MSFESSIHLSIFLQSSGRPKLSLETHKPAYVLNEIAT
jgi:hypothetical protein